MRTAAYALLCDDSDEKGECRAKSEVATPCRPCQSVGKASLAAAIIVVAAGLTLIFLFDLPGGDDVGPGPMCKYKLITTHFQVSANRHKSPLMGAIADVHGCSHALNSLV